MAFTYRNVVLRQLTYAEADGNFGEVERMYDETLDAALIATAAANIYVDTTAGLAATAEGGYFTVPDTGTDELVIYREVAGVATEQIRFGKPFAGGVLTSALDEAPPVTIASAATVDIGAAASNTVIVSGTASITALGTIAAGAIRYIRATGAFTLTHNATSLIIPGGANIVAAAGDVFRFESLGGGNWRMTGFASGTSPGFQPLDATLTSLAALGTAADKMAYTTGVDTWAEAEITAGGRALLQSVVALKTSDQTAIGTAYADVTGTGLAVAANTTYAFEFYIIADADATTTGIDVACNGPAGATSINYTQTVWNSANPTAMVEKSAAAYDSDTASTVSQGTARAIYRVAGILVNGATAGTLIARTKREAVGTGPNVRAGSYGILTKLS